MYSNPMIPSAETHIAFYVCTYSIIEWNHFRYVIPPFPIINLSELRTMLAWDKRRKTSASAKASPLSWSGRGATVPRNHLIPGYGCAWRWGSWQIVILMGKMKTNHWNWGAVLYIYIFFGDWFISSICKATVGFRWSTSPAPAASQNENDSVEMVKWLDMTCDNMIYPRPSGKRLHNYGWKITMFNG